MKICSLKIVSACMIGLLSACVSSADLRRAEIQALSHPTENTKSDANPNTSVLPDFYDTSSFDGLLKSAYRLSSAYLSLADRSQDAQDLAALGLIASAGVAVGGLIFSAPNTVAEAAGLSGGVIGVTNQYYSPRNGVAVYGLGAERLVCIVRAGRKTQSPSAEADYVLLKEARDDSYNQERINIVGDAISAIRVSVRRGSQRADVDFGSLVTSIFDAGKKAGSLTGDESEDEVGVAANDGSAAAAERLQLVNATLRAETATCLALS